MYQWIDILKNKYKGKDIYVIGSGPSLAYVPESFWDGKIIIGVNYIAKFIKCKYLFCKDWKNITGFNQLYSMAADNGAEFVTTEKHGVNDEYNHLIETPYKYWVARSTTNKMLIDVSYIGTDTLVQSHSTITTAIHFAFFLGAKNIIMVGVDGGVIDGKSNIDGYYDLNSKPELEAEEACFVSHQYFEYDLLMLRDKLAEHGCNLLSLNPFINLGMENHVYSRYDVPKEHLWAGDKLGEYYKSKATAK